MFVNTTLNEWVEVWTLVPSRFVIPDDEYPESWKAAMEERAMKACYDVEGGAPLPPFLGGVGLVMSGG